MGKKPSEKPASKKPDAGTSAVLAAAKRASRLRNRILRGNASPEEIDEYKGFPEPKHEKTKAKHAKVLQMLSGDGKVPTSEPLPSGGAESPATENVAGDSFSDPPPPPKVSASGSGSGRPSGSKGWRAKYRPQGSGREGTCVAIGAVATKVMKKLSDYVASTGTKPLFDDDFLRDEYLPAAVLTADALLPKDFETTPEIELVAYSSMQAGQAAIVAMKEKKRLKSSPPAKVIQHPTAQTPRPPEPTKAEMKNPAPSPEAKPKEKPDPAPQTILTRPETIF